MQSIASLSAAAQSSEFQRPNSAQKTCCQHHTMQGLPHTARVVRIGRSQNQQQSFVPQLSKQPSVAASTQFRIGAIPAVMSNVATVQKTTKNQNTPVQQIPEASYAIQLSDFDESGEDYSQHILALKDRDPDKNAVSATETWVTPMQPVVIQPRKSLQTQHNQQRKSSTIYPIPDEQVDLRHARRRVSQQNLAHGTSPYSEAQSEQSAKTHNLGVGVARQEPSPQLQPNTAETFMVFDSLPQSALQQQQQPKVGKIFSRPKTRMLASTAPADTQGHFVPPTYDIDGSRQQARFPQFEEESVSNFSLPANEVQGAFSMKGLRIHEASHDNSNHLKINAASSSRMISSSLSVAEDGLRTVPHDQTMYPETEEGLHALCDFPDLELPLSQRKAINQEDEARNPMRFSASRRPEEVQQQTRMRLHSNFTSIDCRFTQTSKLNLIGEVTPALPALESKAFLKAEPRIKRQASSIISIRTSIDRINMQANMKKPKFDLYDGARDDTEGAQSVCQTCHVRRQVQFEEEQVTGVKLDHKTPIMRMHTINDEDDGRLQEARRGGQAKHQRLHYATSSYSSHRFSYKDRDERGRKKHVKKGRSRRDGSESSRSVRHNKSKEKGPQCGHHLHHQQLPKISPNLSPARHHRSGSRQHGHRPSHYSRTQHYLQDQSRGMRGLQDKSQDRDYNRHGGAHSTNNLSYFSSTKFPNQHTVRKQEIATLASRTQGNHQYQYQEMGSFRRDTQRPRSRSRLHSRGYSNSSSGSRHRDTRSKGSKATTSKRRMTMTLQDRSNAASGVLREGCRSVRRQNTMHYEAAGRDNRSSKHGGQLLDCHSGTYSRRSRRHQESQSPQQYHRSNYSGARAMNHHRANEQPQIKQNTASQVHPQRDQESQYHDTKDAFYQRSTARRQPTSNHGQRQHHHHHAASYKPSHKTSYYHRSSKQEYHHHRYNRHHHHSRGKGSFKTQNERLYRRSRSRHLSSYSSRGGRSLMSSYSRGPPISSFHRSKKFPSQHSSDSPPALPTSGVQIDRSKDAGHFEWRKNMILSSCDPLLGSTAMEAVSSRYQIVDHLGDGTFGRALGCVELPLAASNTATELQPATTQVNNQETKPTYAVKVVRAVPRYTESAKFEAQILKDLSAQGGCERGIVYLKETFTNKSRQSYGNVSNMCLVFEPLGKSLYDFIKDNGYKGFEIGQVREIAIQALHAIEFLHSLKLTHTDLKPENILLKYDAKETITDEANYPVQVQSKRSIYGSQKCSDIDDSSFSGQSQQVRGRKWHKPTSCEIKVIDFGGATYEHERHTLIINTRQYRAPEVILENQTWDEKTDLWSMACILVELYTGELFFDTDENLEHLAMIEKQCGPIPLSMAQRCSNEQIKRQLHREGSREEETYVKNKKMRLRWPASSLRAASRQAVTNMLLLDDIISDKWGEQHRQFKDLLKSMLIIDPRERPSAQECLQHNFFYDIRKLSKSTEKTQVSTADHQFESPRQRQH